MTGRLFSAIAVLIVSGLSALSLGGPIFYLIFYTVSLLLVFALLCVLLARRGAQVHQELSQQKLQRGEEGALRLSLQTRSLLPQGAVRLRLSLLEGEVESLMVPGFFRPTQAEYNLRFAHVGVFPCGVVSMQFQDPMGLIRLRKKGPPLLHMTVLPRSFEVSPLAFARMDDGRALPNRAGEDPTSPEDVRAYRPGDPMKRIHWKLSLRNRELMVRRFEIPAPPDTLILMDCTDPVGFENYPDGRLRLRDTLCETALSVAAMQVAQGHPVRLPLYGDRPSECLADRAGSLELLKEELAYQLFLGGEPFPQVLNLELRRMRRTGATIVITTRLSPQIVEGVNNIRASGPNVRFYLVTFEPEAPQDEALVARLQSRMVEVCYVTPA